MKHTAPVAADLAAVVKRLDTTGFNSVRLTDVRTELALLGVFDRHEQDAVIFAARRAGLISLGAMEGRNGITALERHAAVAEGDALLGFVSLRHS